MPIEDEDYELDSPPEGYRRQRSEEIDTNRIRAEAARQAQRDLLLKQVYKKLTDLDVRQETVIKSMAEGDRRMDGIDSKVMLYHQDLTSQLTQVEAKIDDHLACHTAQEADKKSRWSNILPQVIATVVSVVLTSALIGGIVAAYLPSKSSSQPSEQASNP